MCYGKNGKLSSVVRGLIDSFHARDDINAIIVTPHSGDKEYTEFTRTKEENAAKEMIRAGISHEYPPPGMRIATVLLLLTLD